MKYIWKGDEFKLGLEGFLNSKTNNNLMYMNVPLDGFEKQIVEKFGKDKCTYILYRSVYYDKNTKEIYAYDDYHNCRIEMQDRYIEMLPWQLIDISE